MKPRTKRIRVLHSYSRAAHALILSQGEAAYAGMDGNPDYSNSPVALSVLRTELDSYSAAIVAALDRGRTALALRDSQREIVVRLLRVLAHYVEAACKDNMAVFLSSGFQPVSTVRATAGPLPPTVIQWIEQGLSGQLLIKIAAVSKAVAYELRVGVAETGGPPTSWTSQMVTATKSPFAWNGLTPGATCIFQVRVLGRRGFSDWSDSFTKMCT